MKKLSILFIIIFSVLIFSGVALATGRCQGALLEWYYDGDQDEYGDYDNYECAINDPDDPGQDFWIADSTDCNDNDSSVHPNTDEIVGDGKDNDCDGCNPSAIQAGINCASNGDTLLVTDGTYTENIDFTGKAITLKSVSGAASTIINGNSNGSVVIFNSGETSVSVLDGFTICNGMGTLGQYIGPALNPDVTYGGGILIDNSSPVIRNCIVGGVPGDNDLIGNQASYGAGIACVSSTDPSVHSYPRIEDCTIGGPNDLLEREYNHSYAFYGGAGIYCLYSSPTIKNCTITGNRTTGIGWGGGGGIALINLDHPATIEDCIIEKSTPSGIYCKNLIPAQGQGRTKIIGTDPDRTGTIIRENWTHDDGGGIYLDNSEVDIENCTIDSNESRHAAYSNGAGIFCGTNTSGTVKDCDIINNDSWDEAGGVYVYSGSTMIFENCNITGNQESHSQYGAAGGVVCFNSSPTFKECTISDNYSNTHAGGIRLAQTTGGLFTNCVITGNIGNGGFAGGIYYATSNASFINCTIADNILESGYPGDGIHIGQSGDAILDNCIVWGNDDTNILVDTGCTLTATYSDIGNIVCSGSCSVTNGINADPLFVGSGDYHLTSTSPCIDWCPSAGVNIDIDHETRPNDYKTNEQGSGGNYDIGSDEYYAP